MQRLMDDIVLWHSAVIKSYIMIHVCILMHVSRVLCKSWMNPWYLPVGDICKFIKYHSIDLSIKINVNLILYVPWMHYWLNSDCMKKDYVNGSYKFMKYCGLVWWHRFGSTLALLMAITWTSVDLSSKILWHSPESNSKVLMNLTQWPLEDVEVILQVYFSNSFYELTSWTLLVRLVSGECHGTPLMVQVMAWCRLIYVTISWHH